MFEQDNKMFVQDNEMFVQDNEMFCFTYLNCVLYTFIVHNFRVVE